VFKPVSEGFFFLPKTEGHSAKYGRVKLVYGSAGKTVVAQLVTTETEEVASKEYVGPFGQ
jgi:hypothetical protein